MPAHTHSATSNATGDHNHRIISYYTAGRSGQRGVPNIISNNSNIADVGYTSTNGNHSHLITINSTGSNQYHNNMMPYLVVYIWKRTN